MNFYIKQNDIWNKVDLKNKILIDPPLNQVSEDVALLIHGDGFFDSSQYGIQLTNNNVSISTEQSKFGTSSLYFSGTGTRILLPQETINLSNDFTIEWWEYPTISTAATRFCSAYTGGNVGGLLLGYAGTSVYCASTPSSGWDLISGVNMIDVVPNTWTHRAFVRSNNILYSYKNGVLYTQTGLNGAIDGTGYNMAIGDYRTGDPSYFIGYIEEFCMTKRAKWTTNFTPPVERY